MSEEINLVHTRRKKILGEEKIIKALRIVSIVMLSIVALISITIFILKIRSPLSKLLSEQNALIKSLDTMNTKIVKLSFINDRLKNISAIVGKRPYFDKSIDSVKENLTENIRIDSLDIDRKSIAIIVKTDSLFQFDTLFTNMVDKFRQNVVYRKITLNDLSYNSGQGSYTASIVVDLLQ